MVTLGGGTSPHDGRVKAHGCPVQFSWTRCMTLIHLRLERLPASRDMERTNVMPHHNSVFHQVLKQVPWAIFDAAVETHGSDRGVRTLSTKSQFIALIYSKSRG